MKTKLGWFSLVIAIGGWFPNVHAELLIYRSLEKETVYGGSNIAKRKIKKVIVMDWQTRETKVVSSYKPSYGDKYYYITTLSNVNEHIIDDRYPQSYSTSSTVLVRTDRFTAPNGVYVDIQSLSRGRDLDFRISSETFIHYPKSFKGTDRVISECSCGTFLSKSKTTSLFLRSETLRANELGLSIDQVIEQITAELIEDGFGASPY